VKPYTGKRFQGLVLRSRASWLRNYLKTTIAVAVLSVAVLVGTNRVSAQTAEIQLSSSSINFGSTYVTLAKSASLTIENTGGAALVISKATTSGPFTHGTMNLPRTIEPGDSISVTLWFSPQTTGAATGTLSIFSNASSTPSTVALSGTGLAQTMSLTPSSVNFQNVTVGSTATETETMTNTGTTSLVVYKTSISASAFTLTGLTLPLTIAGGKSVSFALHFTPQSAGTISGSASVSTSMEGSLTASLAGTGVSSTTRTLVASPASLAFGNVDVGSSASGSVSVENTGNSSVSISGVTMSGSGYAATGISANETLAAGQSASMTVVFTPTTASTSSGSISVSSNASNSPLTIGLSGTGVQAAQPSVTLSWSASTSSSVAGYNVYRSTVSGGPYTTLLNGSLVTGLTFTDTNVQAGATYYYVVVAVNSNGVESSDSNQASATIP
jgi:hypothetical protein